MYRYNSGSSDGDVFLFKATVVTETPIFILINTDMKNLWALNPQFEISLNIIAISESKMSVAVKEKSEFGHKRPSSDTPSPRQQSGTCVITASNRASDDSGGFWNEVL